VTEGVSRFLGARENASHYIHSWQQKSGRPGIAFNDSAPDMWLPREKGESLGCRSSAKLGSGPTVG